MAILLVALALQAFNIYILVRSRHWLLISNLALRQQLSVYRRQQQRPTLKGRDRLFWSLLSRVWPDWRGPWLWSSRRLSFDGRSEDSETTGAGSPNPGDRLSTGSTLPSSDASPASLLRSALRLELRRPSHPEYGEDRIALELEIKFCITYSAATVRKYMVKPTRPPRPSQSWKTFLKNQADAIWMCDFCVEYTVRFTALYIFVIMELGSRKVVHINVTEHPTLSWVQQ